MSIESKFARRSVAVLGLMLIYVGISFLYDPTWTYKYGLVSDVSNYSKPLCILMCSIGVYAIWISQKDPKDSGHDVYMCPSCEEAFEKKDVEKRICPECNGMLESIEGFYERHPELKDD